MIAQLIVTLTVAMVVMLLVDIPAAHSTLVGGMISVIANFYYAMKIFASQPDDDPRRVLKAIYFGEVLKILVTVALFGLAIVRLKVGLMYTMLGYISTLFVYWFALIFSGPRAKRMG